MAQRCVNAAITLGKEAVECSNAKLGAYDSLYNVYRKYGKPFQDGDCLPEEYMRDYPRHTHEDAICEGMHRRKEEERQKKEAKGKTSKKYDAGEEDRARPQRVDRGRPKPTRKQSAKRDCGHASTSRQTMERSRMKQFQINSETATVNFPTKNCTVMIQRLMQTGRWILTPTKSER